MKKLVLVTAFFAAVSSTSFAGLPEMMKIYNNPKSAPPTSACKGDSYCNGFVALSKQWNNIPDTYRYKGEYDIKAYARKGITFDHQGRNIGLQRGFYFQTDRSNDLIDGADHFVASKNQRLNTEAGLAVLLYIEDKNGWAID